MTTKTSMGRLTYPGRGLHWDVLESAEWESANGEFYRAELFNIDDGSGAGRSPVFEAYILNRGRWMPFVGNQETAMHKRKMMSLYGEVES